MYFKIFLNTLWIDALNMNDEDIWLPGTVTPSNSCVTLFYFLWPGSKSSLLLADVSSPAGA